MAHPYPGFGSAASVDRVQLARFRDDVGDETLRRYTAVFLDLLEDRLDHIAQAFGGSPEDALSAAFDLQVSCAMLGAARLAEMTAEVEASLRVGVPAGARRMAALRAEAGVVAVALPRAVDRLGPAGEPGG